MLGVIGAESIDDLFVDVPEAARLPAKIEGEFVVELENHKETLANVTVEP